MGHILDSTGITADPEKAAAVTNTPAPENLKELQTFLGMVNAIVSRGFRADMERFRPCVFLLQVLTFTRNTDASSGCSNT